MGGQKNVVGVLGRPADFLGQQWMSGSAWEILNG